LITVKAMRLCAALFLAFSQSVFAQMMPVVGPVAGADASAFLSYSNSYGWEFLALYPFVGLRVEAGDDWTFCLSAFGGAGMSAVIAGGSAPTSGTTKSGESWDARAYGTLCFGGNLEVAFDSTLFGCGYGYEYAAPIPLDNGEGGGGELVGLALEMR
jgi:hypothetical protein